MERGPQTGPGAGALRAWLVISSTCTISAEARLAIALRPPTAPCPTAAPEETPAAFAAPPRAMGLTARGTTPVRPCAVMATETALVLVPSPASTADALPASGRLRVAVTSIWLSASELRWRPSRVFALPSMRAPHLATPARPGMAAVACPL